jgi:hypothetical protein
MTTTPTHTHQREGLSAYNTLLRQRPQASLAQPPAKKGEEAGASDRVTTNGKYHHSTTNSKVVWTNAPQLIRLEIGEGWQGPAELGGVD